MMSQKSAMNKFQNALAPSRDKMSRRSCRHSFHRYVQGGEADLDGIK